MSHQLTPCPSKGMEPTGIGIQDLMQSGGHPDLQELLSLGPWEECPAYPLQGVGTGAQEKYQKNIVYSHDRHLACRTKDPVTLS